MMVALKGEKNQSDHDVVVTNNNKGCRNGLDNCRSLLKGDHFSVPVTTNLLQSFLHVYQNTRASTL